MKRILLIFLTALFLSTSSGISFYFHYCGKVLDGISITGKASCACEDDDESSECCHDKVHVVKINDQFLSADRLLSPAVKVLALFEGIHPTDFIFSAQSVSAHAAHRLLLFDPPNLLKAPLVLRT
jgi:hypothetical protein